MNCRSEVQPAFPRLHRLANRFAAAAGAIVIGLAIGLIGAAAAKEVEPAGKPIPPPMRIVLVKAADAACADNCAEWISAEGAIAPGTDADFRKILKSIGNRKIPIFISSPGGSVEAALAIGRMLRAHHLDIAVTRTDFQGCAPSDKTCSKAKDFKGYRGMPVSDGALCASACPMLIAGGERRLVSLRGFVGVHEITMLERRDPQQYTVERKTVNGKTVVLQHKGASENEAELVAVNSHASIRKYRAQVAQYYREMGVSDKIVDLAFATKAADIHWMTRAELTETHLVTEEAGGETLVGLHPKPVPAATPITSMAQLNWAAPAISKIDPSLSINLVRSVPVPPLDPAVFPMLGPLQTAVAARERSSITTVTTVPAPNFPPPATASTMPFEVAEVGDLPLDPIFDIELTFSHRQSDQTVGWSAMIRARGLSQPAKQLLVRLELPDGRAFSAAPSGTDSALSLKLHGEMALHDYCDLARNKNVRIRLTAPKSSADGFQEIVSEAKKLPFNQALWPDCAAATSPVAQTRAP